MVNQHTSQDHGISQERKTWQQPQTTFRGSQNEKPALNWEAVIIDQRSSMSTDIKLNPHRLPPTWNYKKAYWEKFQEIADGLTKNLFSHHNSIDSNISTCTKSIIQASKLSISSAEGKTVSSTGISDWKTSTSN